MTTAELPGRFAPAGRREQMSTRMMFLLLGLSMAAWAPLVPFAKERLGVDEGTLGLLLLCLGIGSLVMMPLTGVLTNRFGCRRVITLSSIVVIAVLPFLAIASTIPTLALALAVFGASLGTLDVAINIQAVMVEKDSGRTMMSGLHGLFSLGGILGAGGVSLLLGTGIAPLAAILLVVAANVALLTASLGGLLRYGSREGDGAVFALPRGIVVLLGTLCFVVFLSEGAMLDWGALFLIEAHGMDRQSAGLGYAVFALAMTVGRFTGDFIVSSFGPVRVVVASALLGAAGFALALVGSIPVVSLAGFLLIGLGASNIVPILFTAAGRQTVMPPSLAVASVTTLGYAGILIGPALIGAVAQVHSLGLAFTLLSVALVAVALAGPRALRR